jgi:Raf kinase inhibitor-like YbhB/YbcL family protein
MRVNLIIIAISLLTGLSNFAYSQTFTLKSNDLTGQFTNKFMSGSFGCNGENKSPQLEWSAAPPEAKSFAVTMYDQDAPTGSGWWHWVVFDIPNTSSKLIQDAGNNRNSLLPEGSIQGLTDFGTNGYGGPCPPPNDKPHAYVVTVYALKVAHLGLDKNATPALAGFIINQNLLAKASLIIYSKR